MSLIYIQCVHSNSGPILQDMDGVWAGVYLERNKRVGRRILFTESILLGMPILGR